MNNKFDVENTNIKSFLAQKPVSSNMEQTEAMDVENTNIKQFLAKKSPVAEVQAAGNVPSSLSTAIAGPKGSSLVERLNEGVNRINQGAQAFNVGVEAFGTTIAKGLSTGVHAALPESIAKYMPKPKDYQKKYDARVSEYEKNKQENPALAGLNFAGQLAATLVLPGVGLPKAVGTIGKAGGNALAEVVKGYAGKSALGSAGQIAGQVLGGAAYGGMLGGMNTEKGQETVLNQPGMASGVAIGGVMGPVQGFIGKNVDDLPAYQQTLSQVNKTINGKEVQFKGPTFNAIPNYESGRIDTILQKMPSYLGTNPHLEAESKAFRPYISDMINAVSSNNIEASRTVIGNEIVKRADAAKALYSQAWEAVPKAYVEAGIKTVPQAKDTLQALQSNISAYKDSTTKYVMNRVNELTAVKNPTPAQAIKIQQSLWELYSGIHKNGTSSPALKDLAEKELLPTFWKLGDDIGAAAQGTNAENVFKYAKSVSKGYHNTFNPKVNPLLVDAVDDINGSRRGVKALVDDLVNPKTKLTGTDIKSYTEFMGPRASNELENVGLRQLAKKSGIPELIDNNMNVGNKSLNLSTFLTGVEQRLGDSAASKHIYKKSYESLKGLEVLGQNYLKMTQGMPDAVKKSGGASLAIPLGIAAGATATIGTAAANIMTNPAAQAIAISNTAKAVAVAVSLSTTAMSLYKASQPLKRALGYVTKTMGAVGIQPQLQQYLLNKANDNLVKAGLIYKQQPDGSVLIDAEPKKPRKEPITIMGVYN